MMTRNLRKLTLLMLAAIALPALGALDVFVTGADKKLFANRFTNGTWTGWTPLDVLLLGSPDATSVDGSPDVFYRGADNALWQLQKRRNTWGTPVRVGGVITSDPGATTVRGALRVFARGTDKGMWQIGHSGTAWGNWEPLGGEFPEGAAPDAVSFGDQIVVVARGMDQAIWANFWDGALWSDWTPLGGEFIGDPTVTYHPARQRLEIYAVGTDRKMFVNTRTGTTWSGWNRMPVGEFDAGTAPDAVFDGNETVLVARGTNYVPYFHGATGWQPLGNLAIRNNTTITNTNEGEYRVTDAPPRAARRYRVTLNGFTVNRETNDDPLERHGARDEVYLYALTDVVGANAATTVVATRIHGDDHNNPDHRRAGRAWNPSLVGARGGFMTGDSHPPDSPAVRFGDVRFEAPASRPPTNTRPGSVENIPLIVWTGELIRGENYAVIVPAVVESDHTLPAAGLPLTVGVRANRFAAAWRDAFAPNAVNAGAIAAIEERTRNAGRSFVTVGRSGDLDRPIGMDAIDAHTFGWNAVPIVLTYDRAEELLSQSVTLQTMQNGTTTESPLPRGTFFIEYRDHPDLAGHYTLFWQIERVESAPPM